MFKPGESGNPLGRPRGAAGIARYAAEQTKDGAELVDFLLAVMRDTTYPKRERLAACTALLDRVAGKPLQPSEVALVNAGDDVELPGNWHSMSDVERATWLRVYRATLLGAGATSS
jgi:hypothetical protein